MFEMFQLPFMVQAFAAAVITGILLSYLGVHVVGRGIVFVDLALGQISSLGVAFATFIGTGFTSIPLIFTLAGALQMSFINIRDRRLKQKAIIGILYAFASANAYKIPMMASSFSRLSLILMNDISKAPAKVK